MSQVQKALQFGVNQVTKVKKVGRSIQPKPLFVLPGLSKKEKAALVKEENEIKLIRAMEMVGDDVIEVPYVRSEITGNYVPAVPVPTVEELPPIPKFSMNKFIPGLKIKRRIQVHLREMCEFFKKVTFNQSLNAYTMNEYTTSGFSVFYDQCKSLSSKFPYEVAFNQLDAPVGSFIEVEWESGAKTVIYTDGLTFDRILRQLIIPYHDAKLYSLSEIFTIPPPMTEAEIEAIRQKSKTQRDTPFHVRLLPKAPKTPIKKYKN